MIYVIATLRIKAGSKEAVAAAALPCILATRGEAGCISYDLLGSVTDPETVVFVEEWESREALQAHFGQPHLDAWRLARAPYEVSAEVVIIHPDRVERL